MIERAMAAHCNLLKPDEGFGLSSIPAMKDIFIGDLAQIGDWVVADVEGSVFWPVTTQKVSYRGEELWVIPITQECYGALAMRTRPGLDRVACQKVLLRFLSSLSWLEGRGVSMVHGFGGGSFARPSGRPNRVGIGISQQFDLTNLPEPTDARACLALALMREGRALNHPGYAFISFFRAIEVALPNGLKRGQWIAAKIPTLTGFASKPAVDKLAASGIQDIGEHLRESNRHAMAHAQRGPIIDPDDYEETRRLNEELPIADLAILALEEFFGIETRQTVYRR